MDSGEVGTEQTDVIEQLHWAFLMFFQTCLHFPQLFGDVHVDHPLPLAPDFLEPFFGNGTEAVWGNANRNCGLPPDIIAERVDG